MNHRMLKQIFKAFEMMNRCYEGEGGAASGAEGGENAGDIGGNIIEEKDQDPEPIDVTTYIGDEKSNPSQRPMKEFDRAGMTKKDIDRMIEHADGDIFLSDEQIKILEDKKAEEEKDGKGKDGDKKVGDDKGGDDKTGKQKEDDKDKDGKGDDDEVKVFYEKSGFTEEEFNSLSEKAQENLVDKIFSDGTDTTQLDAFKTENDKLKSDIDTLMGDSYIATRVEEQSTGKSLIATPEKIVTDEFFVKFDNLVGDEKTTEAKKMLTDAAAALLKSERQVGEKRSAVKEGQKDAWKVLKKLGEIDKRLAIEEKDFEKLKPGHVEWNKYKGKDGLGEAVEFLEKKGHTFQTVKNYTADEIYTLFSKDKGWDKKRDKDIHDAGKKSVLEKLRNPEMAKSLKQGKRKVIPGSKTASMGIDRDTLKAELVNGNEKRYQELMTMSEGKPKMTAILSQIYYEAGKERDTLAKK